MNNSLPKIKTAIYELIKSASTVLPDDVEKKLYAAQKEEKELSPAKAALNDILETIKISKNKGIALCQDTGTNIFYIYHPKNFAVSQFRELVIEAVKNATEEGILRPNSVDPITGKNTGTNTGDGHPSLTFIQWHKDYTKVDLMLKGGGCENMGAQYSLPDEKISAGRDINGIKKAILDAIFNAQGYGCAPGIIGVCIGGDRSDSAKAAKKELFRKLGSKNPNPVLSEIEEYITREAARLEIGPMGYGGKTTLLGAFVTKLNRIPASFFVSISYMCWCCRRKSLKLFKNGEFEIE
jgi:fumarate hydratase class I